MKSVNVGDVRWVLGEPRRVFDRLLEDSKEVGGDLLPLLDGRLSGLACESALVVPHCLEDLVHFHYFSLLNLGSRVISRAAPSLARSARSSLLRSLHPAA